MTDAHQQHENHVPNADDLDDPKDLAARHAGHGGGCPLAEPSYYAALFTSIRGSIQPSDDRGAEAILLYAKIISDTEMHDHFDNIIFLRLSVEVLQFLQDKRSSGFQAFDSDLHVLLWCAVRSYLDSDSFNKLISLTRHHIPPCLVSMSLLPLAARSLNDSAVETLLLLMKSHLNNDSDISTSVLLRTLRNLLFVEQYNNRPEAGSSWKRRLTNTVRLLLDSGAKLASGNHCQSAGESPPIFSLIPLASHGLTETIEVILKAASISDLNYYPESNSFNGYQPRTALTLAMIAFKQRFFINPIPERFLLSMERQSRGRAICIMKNVILPLMKSGAILPRDLLDFGYSRMDDWFNYYRSLVLLPDYSPSLSEFNDTWVIFYYRLLLEARMTSRLNVEAFKAFLQQNQMRWRERELQFATFVMRSGEFPRSLQSQCRTALLRRCLPGGLTQRNAAIKSLNLPGCIEDYLMFADYDLPVRRLEIKEATEQQQMS